MKANEMKNSAKAIIKKLWKSAPDVAKECTEGAIIVSMAAAVLSAPKVDECSKQAVKDMAHELSYTWDPFDGFCA